MAQPPSTIRTRDQTFDHGNVEGIWNPGVERDSAISSSVITSSILSNNGEDR
jgi:hypothetical protein